MSQTPSVSHTPTLVLIHAFPMGARMWDAQRTALQQSALQQSGLQQSALPGWRVLTPSLPGFDGRPLEGEPTMAGYARDLIATLDREGVGRAVFCGLSLGGYVLFEVLRQAPSRAAGLIFADTRTSVDTPDRVAARERSIVRARTEGSVAIADEMLPGLLGPTTHATRPQVVAQVRAFIESQPSETIAAGLQAIMTRVDSAAVLPSIEVPTLIIVGDEDVITPPSDAEAMHRLIRGSTLVTITGAGHMSNLEDPAAFNAAIQSLVGRGIEP